MMYWTLWLSVWHILQASGCNNGLINSINVTTELQSDVLLPCYFEPSLLGSDRTADIAAVWTYRNITVDNLLEIKLQGVVGSWNMRGGRIETFPKLSESGNFSILLHKVQQSDLGLYRCQLYKGINCSIAYQELNLTLRAQSLLAQKWLIIAVTGGGGAVILIALVVSFYCMKKRCNNASKDAVYENTRFEQRKTVELTVGTRQMTSPTSESGVCPKNPRKTNQHNIYANKSVDGGAVYVNQLF